MWLYGLEWWTECVCIHSYLPKCEYKCLCAFVPLNTCGCMYTTLKLTLLTKCSSVKDCWCLCTCEHACAHIYLFTSILPYRPMQSFVIMCVKASPLCDHHTEEMLIAHLSTSTLTISWQPYIMYSSDLSTHCTLRPISHCLVLY